jgi:hypothetical protein
MSQRRRKSSRSKNRKKSVDSRDFWGADEAEQADLELIQVAQVPTTMVLSLGPPPLPGHDQLAEHYFTAVYDKASSLATALAATADLLDFDSLDDEA